MISLKQFKYFIEIVEAGSYSRAAEKLFIAQSALSRQIKELEDELQTPLLTRDARQFELTPAGRLFFERGKRILEDIDDTLVQARHVGQGAQGVIRLQHSSSVILTPRISNALAHALAQHPGVTLDVSMLPSENQTMEIEEGRVDIGLLRLPTLRRHPHIQVREIGSEPLMVAVARDSPLAALDNVELADLSAQAFISIPHKDRGGLSYLVANLCLEQGFFPKPARALSRKSSQLNLIEAGLGIAIVPECMRLTAPAGVHFVRLSHGRLLSSVGLATRREADPLVAAFTDTLVARLAPSS
ncbi:LysR family transcriptional regulator [Pseudoduganella sp. FT25W]|uniref:LysR family transcriptional regulator n=1 Tax=Duganella alba TaxID=2666081 RepID=A0A6L5QHU3_9BURK|nr:LysR family transcriptional regulator [Duganella alba]MRX15655.1 LysR family transcriptional regulator [Duganella alba]